MAAFPHLLSQKRKGRARRAALSTTHRTSVPLAPQASGRVPRRRPDYPPVPTHSPVAAVLSSAPRPAAANERRGRGASARRRPIASRWRGPPLASRPLGARPWTRAGRSHLPSLPVVVFPKLSPARKRACHRGGGRPSIRRPRAGRPGSHEACTRGAPR